MAPQNEKDEINECDGFHVMRKPPVQPAGLSVMVEGKERKW